MKYKRVIKSKIQISPRFITLDMILEYYTYNDIDGGKLWRESKFCQIIKTMRKSNEVVSFGTMLFRILARFMNCWPLYSYPTIETTVVMDVGQSIPNTCIDKGMSSLIAILTETCLITPPPGYIAWHWHTSYIAYFILNGRKPKYTK